ncbi:hypothetical protein L1049_026110 [Liquidambar formosana]|uniref:AAA+ ATPase domain-containing protein n=1 Tax=Liquidambar formosana TaxID=63359 RepID=A0AAP0NGB7_LIQFO
MEESPEQETPVTEAKDGGLPSSERRSVRRRLIQSTLFPHRSLDNVKESEDKQEDEDCDEDEDEDEEYCGSQSKKKRKRKRKAMPQSRASKKVTENGKESPSRRVDDKDSPVIIKSDFFIKVSEKRLQKMQQKKKQQVDSPEGNNKTCSPSDSVANMKSPRQLKEKRKVNTTPVKNVTSEHASQPIPDLRLEAKMTAEENSRMFEGRQIHPFFSSWRSSKRYQETTELESNWCPVEGQDTSITLGPIHVFETVQDDAVSLDWRNWKFCESTFINSDCGLESAFSSLFEGSVESLHFDNILRVSHPSIASFHQNELFLDQCPIQQECLHEPTGSSMLADGQVVCYQLSKDKEVEQEVDKVGFISRYADHLKNSDEEEQSRFLQERMKSYYLGRGNLPEDSLWTKKYQPENAMEVCGNSESVKFLSEWLHLWHEIRSSKNSTKGDKCVMQDEDHSCYESDSDSENIDEGDKLKNVLLVTGPVGSGKSAAIYACAKEQGFEVIEVNTSHWRNGALLKQKFGEAVESRRLKWSLENHLGSQRKPIMNSSPALPNGKASQEFDNEVIELIPLSDEEDPHETTGASGKFVCNESRTACDRREIKSLVLFDDVDITFIEDRGFIAAIQQIAETAKLPMILTTNSNGPILPDNLDRLEVCFTTPSPKELFCHVYMVSAAEKVNIQPQLIDRFIGYCHGDIRKTIMHLQFWCQGQRNRKDRKVQRTYGPLLFDLEAGHQLLPKIIPWDLPSQLSELVEKEITKSLSLMEENFSIMEVVEEEELDNEGWQNGLVIHNSETSSLEAKRKQCSPVAFARRRVRRKLDTVLSSSSEDEFCGDKFPVVSVKETNGEVLLESDCKFLPLFPASECCLNPLTDQLLHSEGGNLGGNHYQCSDTADDLHINDTCRSVDISYVPESSFVPETEINCGTELLSRTVSWGYVTDIIEADTMSNALIKNLSPLKADNLDKSIPRLCRSHEIMKNSCDVNGESTHGEEVGDSQNEHLEAVMRGYQVMDECSRMDFNRKLKSVDEPRSSVLTDSVQETWRKLRGCHSDLRQYVTSEQKDASRILKLAFGMSNLISEADMLLSNCQFDSMERPMVPSEETDAISWCNEQLQMTSTFAQHGFCFYAKDIAALGSNLGSGSRVDLAWEMLASTTDTMALGKLVRQDVRTSWTPYTGANLEMRLPKSGISLKSELESCLYGIVQSLVPSRSYMTLKGDAFHEYLSSLGQISRSEASRLSESIDKTKRQRRRVARHYLSTGARMLPPTDISLLSQYNCYGKFSFQSTDASST